MFSLCKPPLCIFVKNTGQVLNESGITNFPLIPVPKMEGESTQWGRANRHGNTTMSD
jgi:hypothetical protein